MSKGMNMNMNMLRTRRKDNNVKPNRRLDRKSSRGMIYENEELRLKTININAEIERGQSDIKKLKRENDMLKKEIWCLRDEYEKLDKLLKEKDLDFSASSTTCTSDSESTSSYTEESGEVETSQNMENVQKTTNMNMMHSNFDLLSIVPEENSTDYNSEKLSAANEQSLEREIIKADQCYPDDGAVTTACHQPVNCQPMHFFSPLPPRPIRDQTAITGSYDLLPCNYKTAADLLLKTDNNGFKPEVSTQYKTISSSSFSNGGNLEELLNDIENISHDILQLSSPSESKQHLYMDPPPPQPPPLSASGTLDTDNKEYKSELSVVLMPKPMPLLGFERYQRALRRSCESLGVGGGAAGGGTTPIGFDRFQNGRLQQLSCDNIRLAATSQDVSTCSDPGRPILDSHIQGDVEVPRIQVEDEQQHHKIYPYEHSDEHCSNTEITPHLPDSNIPQVTREDPNPVDDRPTVIYCNGNVKHIPNGIPNSEENEEALQFQTSSTTTTGQSNSSGKDNNTSSATEKPERFSIRKKVSIHFKGKRDRAKEKEKEREQQQQQQQQKKGQLQKTASVESKQSDGGGKVAQQQTPQLLDPNRIEAVPGTDGKVNGSTSASPRMSVSISASPERKRPAQSQHKSRHNNTTHRHRNRRRSTASGLSNTAGAGGGAGEHHQHRSYSICTEQQQQQRNWPPLDDLLLFGGGHLSDRSSSASSGRSCHRRKLSNLSSVRGAGGGGGKLPWCACWGNGCL